MTTYAVGQPRRQSLAEEVVNAVTHGIGALLGIAGLCLLLYRSIRYGETVHVVSVTIFAISMILLYLVSCL